MFEHPQVTGHSARKWFRLMREHKVFTSVQLWDFPSVAALIRGPATCTSILADILSTSSQARVRDPSMISSLAVAAILLKAWES
mmetsp:Transcript_18570/g.51151  ORF Transcript_18570/g.51151 Transcript_18570/m.51151 type:complete len:84 (-) Transcript_18570:798-1049(-)